MRVGLRRDYHRRPRLVRRLLLERRWWWHVLVLVGTRLPSRLIMMGRRARMRVVGLGEGVGVVHRRLRRRMVVCVRVVFLLSPRLGVHGRPLVHVWLAWPGRHVVVHDAGGGRAQTAVVTETSSAACGRRGRSGGRDGLPAFRPH